MHAIVRQGDGKYYISAVFGYYKDITATEDHARYLEEIYKPYWIVWDAEKKRLIRWSSMVPNTQYMIPQVLIVDAEQTHWNMDDEGVGCVDFLSRELLDSFLDEEVQPESILAQCRAMDEGYVYHEVVEIKTSQDIENLACVSGGFHDAYIVKEEPQDDGSLYLRFDGTWGCEIEVWFQGDLAYNTSRRDSGDFDPIWFGATVILENGFVYLVDEDDMTVEDISEETCYFKARHMKYRVIPD